ncbi:hypothetical protein D9M70_595030 [compost metagenome]
MPLGQRHLAHIAVLDLDGQAVADDAGVVHQAVDRTEITGDLLDHMHYLLFVGHVADIGTGVAAGGLASSHRFVQSLTVEVDQGQFRTLGSQVFAHRAAETLATAGDDDDLVFQLHVVNP